MQPVVNESSKDQLIQLATVTASRFLIDLCGLCYSNSI